MIARQHWIQLRFSAESSLLYTTTTTTTAAARTGVDCENGWAGAWWHGMVNPSQISERHLPKSPFLRIFIISIFSFLLFFRLSLCSRFSLTSNLLHTYSLHTEFSKHFLSFSLFFCCRFHSYERTWKLSPMNWYVHC